MPTLIETLDTKQVISGAVGDSFAFLLGVNLRYGDESGSNGPLLHDEYEILHQPDMFQHQKNDRTMYETSEYDRSRASRSGNDTIAAQRVHQNYSVGGGAPYGKTNMASAKSEALIGQESGK